MDGFITFLRVIFYTVLVTIGITLCAIMYETTLDTNQKVNEIYNAYYKCDTTIMQKPDMQDTININFLIK